MPPDCASTKRCRLNGSLAITAPIARPALFGFGSGRPAAGAGNAGSGAGAHPAAVEPADALAEGHDRCEAAMLVRGDQVLDLIVEHEEAAGGAGQQQHMGAADIVAADTDIEILGIEPRRLESLHLDDGDILAVAIAAAKR